MRVLLIGSGGREHALALALSHDPSVEYLACAPGNPGIGKLAELHNVDILDGRAVTALAQSVKADLVVVGPEAPLVQGVADDIRSAGIACFGPSRQAAQLEGSKAFAKDVMAAAGVPTARARVCPKPEEAAKALDEFGPPYVVKDDGLAAGKGVVVTNDRQRALEHAAQCAKVLVEEYLDGPEVSLFVVTDGVAALPLLPAQDYKRVGDGNTGPNTGGMGAYCPLPWLPPDFVEAVVARIVQPTLAEMRRRGTPFQGLLYCGLAVTPRGPYVVEFNARFGDPETQAILPLLETPFARLLDATAAGKLSEHPPLRWRDGAAVAVVLAAKGYPTSTRTGDQIVGADSPGLLHAGTILDSGGILRTAGGRVLTSVSVGDDLEIARNTAYEQARNVSFDGMQYRSDIAL